MKLNQQQSDLIIGTLLGDGNLQTETKGRTWRYRALHKAEHRDYLFHKYEILKPLCESPPIYDEVFDPRTQKNYTRWYFNTVTQDCFKHFANLFYTFDKTKNKMVKDVPKNIELFLTPQAIAYMYMDDGSLKWLNHSNAMRICTESFSEAGVTRLQNALQNKFEIQTTLTPEKNNDVVIGYRISINERNSSKFRELIQSYLVDCMKYKVSDGNKGHL
jgi:hypothetical protein